ncbi:clavesin-1-like [Schistocerca gregaria]|uniref:clavesin-1-like n=1 Tax=Schistocerca gregaria TaxID=7010 RepID=UPI00211DF33F|nr:clavesin-1-like [Schistocerca gregaria]
MEPPQLHASPLEENAASASKALRQMRALLAERPDVELSILEDWYLLRFLRCKLYDPTQALRLAQLYEEFVRQRGPGWRRPSRPWVRRCMTSGVLEVRARRLLLLRLGRWRPAGWQAEELLQAAGLCGEVAALEPAAQLSGVQAVFDLRGLGLEQLRALSPGFARTMVHYLANCFPIRINGVHVVNEPAIFGLVFSLFKSFLNERMQKRLFLHGHDMESLHSHITPDWLPPDLGGSGKETDLNEWLSYVLSQPVVLGLKKVGYIFEDDVIT